MSEVPEDVMAAAKLAVENWARDGAAYVSTADGGAEYDRCVGHVARAITAERERCAKIADKLTFNAHELAQATEWGRGASSIAHEIVAAIRAGIQP